VLNGRLCAPPMSKQDQRLKGWLLRMISPSHLQNSRTNVETESRVIRLLLMMATVVPDGLWCEVIEFREIHKACVMFTITEL
jgi:hypothetical protein